MPGAFPAGPEVSGPGELSVDLSGTLQLGAGRVLVEEGRVGGDGGAATDLLALGGQQLERLGRLRHRAQKVCVPKAGEFDRLPQPQMTEMTIRVHSLSTFSH